MCVCNRELTEHGHSHTYTQCAEEKYDGLEERVNSSRGAEKWVWDDRCVKSVTCERERERESECVCAVMCVRVRVCVCVRERERERERVSE